MKASIKKHIINMVEKQIEFEEYKARAGCHNELEEWKEAKNEIINDIISDEEIVKPYYVSSIKRKEFKCWLIVNDLNTNSFARLVGCSRQYIEKIINGQVKVTQSVRDKFSQGGYNNL